MDANYIHGPYVHGLNKGGLKQIISQSKLLGTSASNHMANDHPAVRAYEGTFEFHKKNKNWHGRDRVIIEFMTRQPSRGGMPPGAAEWTAGQLNNNYLDIKILRVLNGEGEQVRV